MQPTENHIAPEQISKKKLGINENNNITNNDSIIDRSSNNSSTSASSNSRTTPTSVTTTRRRSIATSSDNSKLRTKTPNTPKTVIRKRKIFSDEDDEDDEDDDEDYSNIIGSGQDQNEYDYNNDPMNLSMFMACGFFFGDACFRNYKDSATISVVQHEAFNLANIFKKYWPETVVGRPLKDKKHLKLYYFNQAGSIKFAKDAYKFMSLVCAGDVRREKQWADFCRICTKRQKKHETKKKWECALCNASNTMHFTGSVHKLWKHMIDHHGCKKLNYTDFRKHVF